MIQSFAHKGLADFFYTGTLRGIQAKHALRLRLILDLLDNVEEVRHVDFPGSGLHPLSGSLQGHWSIKVSGNWRIIFRFKDGDAHIVNYIDYH